jgi:CTP:phosphocholine cytidylyltransferase-like protein
MKIQRAIILAAGQGLRLKPLTDKTPKPLLKVNGKPMIESEIEILQSIGINDIHIVTGYLAEKFDYLKKKYGVILHFNKNWKMSNLMSLNEVVELIDCCVILDADVIIKPAAIRTDVMHSGYSFTKEKKADEWGMAIDASGKILAIDNDLSTKHDFNALRSVSYWIEPESTMYRLAIMDAVSNNTEVNYCDDIAIRMPDLYAYEMKKADFKEIDTVEDYKNVEKIR